MNQIDTHSLWTATANSYENGKTLEGNEETDVVVSGAGFTGLSSAYHLQKSGKYAIALEQATSGYGASGSNGGMVLPGYKPTIQRLAKNMVPTRLDS